MKLNSNDFRGGLALGLLALAFIALGLVALYFIKKYGKEVFAHEGAKAFTWMILGGSAVMYFASFIGFMIVSGPRGPEVDFPAYATALDAAKFIGVTFLAVAIQAKAEEAWASRSLNDRNAARTPTLAPLIGGLALAMAYIGWPVANGVSMAATNPSFLPEMPAWIWSETVGGYQWLFSLIEGALSNPLSALEALRSTFVYHQGNQFAFASYFSAILFLWAIIEFVLRPLRSKNSEGL